MHQIEKKSFTKVTFNIFYMMTRYLWFVICYLISEYFFQNLAITCKNLFLSLVVVRLVIFYLWLCHQGGGKVLIILVNDFFCPFKYTSKFLCMKPAKYVPSSEKCYTNILWIIRTRCSYESHVAMKLVTNDSFFIEQ